MELKWKLLSEESKSAGFRKLVRRRFELPDGHQDDFDLYADGSTATTALLPDDNHIVLVRHFRPGPMKILDELIGGFVEPDESPHETIAREVMEEIGYLAEFEHIGSTYFGAYAVGQKHIFIGHNAKRVAIPNREIGEQMEVIIVTLDQYKKNILAGLTTDMDAGLLVLHHLGKL